MLRAVSGPFRVAWDGARARLKICGRGSVSAARGCEGGGADPPPKNRSLVALGRQERRDGSGGRGKRCSRNFAVSVMSVLVGIPTYMLGTWGLNPRG